ncbi:MAG: hypothetical protein J6W49_01265 [Paludibacteraceae bacterium]|nr:hypothetical protein [Paludibacteraceae bacterium]MBP5136275.1 hypothetical protein [Paludibacteraceae bacterium]MBP5742060.1 hypothetical protein [Paludibacteraceae bacterium]
MRRLVIYVMFAGLLSLGVNAQSPGDTFIKIEKRNMFSQCFADCDANDDGIVTYAEAEAATVLSLDKGGRLNIIESYDFLKYFPNLTLLSLGNTTEEVVDLHYQTRLKRVNVAYALWLKRIIVSENVTPEVTGQPADDPFRGAVKVERYVSDPVARGLYEEGFVYVEPVSKDTATLYIVALEPGAYGVWHNDSLEVPCEYSLDSLKAKYFTVAVNGDEIIEFADEAFKAFCLRTKKADANKDGGISRDEAAALKKLSLMNFKSFVYTVKSFKDLKYFPNLETFHAGLNFEERIDLSSCPNLKDLDLSDSRMLREIVLAKGCEPVIKQYAYPSEPLKITYAK